MALTMWHDRGYEVEMARTTVSTFGDAAATKLDEGLSPSGEGDTKSSSSSNCSFCRSPALSELSTFL
jgi:hypothetical protein